MPNYPLAWRTNLRANLVLWPDLAANIAALASRDGDIYDEAQLLAAFPTNLTNTRAVRNTFEVLALAGLAVKDGNPGRFELTSFGRCVFTFLGVGGGPRFINTQNRHLLAELFIRALSTVVEYRAIWGLMRRTGDLLSNEELNRAMGQIDYLDDVPVVAQKIVEARERGDVTFIGERLYEPEEYTDPTTRPNQRKAMTPLFQLAGGGKLFITLDDDRRLEDWAIPFIDRRLAEPCPMLHASTDVAVARLMAEYATPPFDVWRN